MEAICNQDRGMEDLPIIKGLIENSDNRLSSKSVIYANKYRHALQARQADAPYAHWFCVATYVLCRRIWKNNTKFLL